jgi:uncharacterized protein
MTNTISVDIDEINAPFWSGLKKGQLLFQACKCGHHWLPPRYLCPKCLSEDIKWQQASGVGSIVSWVIYHVAYHPEFKDKLPYNVAIVRLEEGPQMITNIVGDTKHLKIGAQVFLKIDHSVEQPLAQFVLSP